MNAPNKSIASNLKLIQTDPDILETRAGGGCLLLFGLPFLLAGLFVMAASLKLVPIQSEVEWYFGIPFGGIFALVGAGLMFGRSGMTIDRRQQTVSKWWGILVPMKRDEYPLDQYSRVTLGRETRSSGDSSVTVFPVKLEGAGEVKALEIQAPQIYPAGRQLAETLAKFLNRPLVDTSTGQAVTREPDKLDEPLREQARRTREKVEWTEPPYGSKIQVHDEAGLKIFELPPPAPALASYLQLVAALGFVGFVSYFFLIPLARLPMPPQLRYIFFGFIGLFFILGPIWSALRGLLAPGRKNVRVAVSRDSLRVEEPGLLRKKAKEIPLGELEELVLPEMNPELVPGRKLPDGTTLPPSPRMMAVGQFMAKLIRNPGITARSDKMSMEFGQGLTKPELIFLHAAIKQLIIE